VLLVVLVQKLRLEAGYVHVGRTLRLAGLALQTQVEHLVQRRVGQAAQAELPGEREPQGVGPAAGAVLFLARRLVRRAHGPVALLAALADAGAQLRGPRDSAVAGEIDRKSVG